MPRKKYMFDDEYPAGAFDENVMAKQAIVDLLTANAFTSNSIATSTIIAGYIQLGDIPNLETAIKNMAIQIAILEARVAKLERPTLSY